MTARVARTLSLDETLSPSAFSDSIMDSTIAFSYKVTLILAAGRRRVRRRGEGSDRVPHPPERPKAQWRRYIGVSAAGTAADHADAERSVVLRRC